jgi:hypothetical protein
MEEHESWGMELLFFLMGILIVPFTVLIIFIAALYGWGEQCVRKAKRLCRRR